MEPLPLGDRLVAITDLPDDAQVLSIVDEDPQRMTHQRIVVGDEYTNRFHSANPTSLGRFRSAHHSFVSQDDPKERIRCLETLTRSRELQPPLRTR